MCLEQRAKSRREGGPAPHRILSRHEELDVLGHEGKDRIHIPFRRGAMPPLDKTANASFIGVHGLLRFDASHGRTPGYASICLSDGTGMKGMYSCQPRTSENATWMAGEERKASSRYCASSRRLKRKAAGGTRSVARAGTV